MVGISLSSLLSELEARVRRFRAARARKLASGIRAHPGPPSFVWTRRVLTRMGAMGAEVVRSCERVSVIVHDLG